MAAESFFQILTKSKKSNLRFWRQIYFHKQVQDFLIQFVTSEYGDLSEYEQEGKKIITPFIKHYKDNVVITVTAVLPDLRRDFKIRQLEVEEYLRAFLIDCNQIDEETKIELRIK